MWLLDPNSDGRPGAAVVRPNRGRLSVAAVISAAMHAVALILLVWRPAIFVQPRLIAHGEGGSATPLAVALYLPRSTAPAAPVSPSQVFVRVPVSKAAKHRRSNALDNDQTADAAEAGSPRGSAFAGAVDGDDVRPAIPLPGSFSDPQVSRWELPAGLQGDVVVEITIDDHGAVVDERLLQGVGHGIDERVIAAIRDWRFRPATRNGIAVPSKQDYHYHFPS